MAINFTKDNFDQEVIAASAGKPVLVDFFAVWCGPCQMMAPVLDQLTEALGERAVIGKLDTEQEPELTEKYDVMSLPALIIFKNGEPVETLIGIQSRDSLIKMLEKYM